MLHFKDSKAQLFWLSLGSKQGLYPGIARILMRKLRMLDAARQLYDLREPPGNKFKALHGDRRGQFSIRVNAQYRICFNWSEEGARNIEVLDYHH